MYFYIDLVSIHLMLLFIYLTECTPVSLIRVSIHLMLLFITKMRTTLLKHSCFNTSHVTLYQNVRLHISGWRFCVSIHLMLLFIKFHYVPNILINIVSIHLMLLFIMTPEYTAAHNDGFNTSHVTLYQYAIILTVQERMFQYISCYSLSTVYRPRHIWLRAFQYISCYSLSIY